jgi:hypothetical protein
MSAASVEGPSSPASHHQEPAEGNPDASLFVAAHDSAGHARHACVDRERSLGSVARMRAVCCTGSLWRSLAHSRCCRDRSTNRSGPGRGSGHRDTDGRLHLPVYLRHTDVDESPHRWDTAPAYVPRHVVGRGVETNFQVGIGAVPVFNEDSHLTHLLPLHHHRSWLLGAFRSRTAAHVACSRQRRWLLVVNRKHQAAAMCRSTPPAADLQSQYESQIPERLPIATPRLMQPRPAWRRLTAGPQRHRQRKLCGL